MHRAMIKAIGTVSLLVSTYAYALPFFGGDSGTDNTAAASSGAGATQGTAPHVMSPDEFSSKVSELSQAVNSNLSQQASAALAQRPLTPNASTNTNVMSSPAPLMPSGPTVTTQTTVQTSSPVAGNTQNTIEAPTEPNEQEQNFTGFGTGNSNTGTAPRSAPGNNSGGWSVQY